MDARDGPFDTRVKDIVQSKTALTDDDGGVLTTAPSATVFDCIGRMVDHDVGSIVVMDGDAIAGIFTERDYMQSIALEGRSSKETEVREVMERDVAKVDPEKPLEECMHLMTRLRCRHLPVVDEDGDLIGLVSIGDCVKRILDTAQAETDRLRKYVTGRYPG
jgi:CBS domain-containing protein